MRRDSIVREKAMHIIAMKKSIVDENPWVPRNLYNAFVESKNRSIERLFDPAVSRYPLPWGVCSLKRWVARK